MALRRLALFALVLVSGAFVGERLAPSRTPSTPLFFPGSAEASEAIRGVADGEVFVSTEEGNAYLWKRIGDRIELIGQCSRVEGGNSGQASFVWMPGVERRN